MFGTPKMYYVTNVHLNLSLDYRREMSCDVLMDALQDD